MKTLKSAARAAIGYERRKQLRRAAAKCAHFGLARSCPCCKSYLRSFKAYGLVPRLEARCPICGSLERHRLMYLYMTRKTDLFNGRRKKMLHVAPEPELSQWFQKTEYIDYLSADLSNPRAMVRMDISDIQYRDNTFDVIYCSHVLEHVPDDRKAMREFWRVLKIGGWAILQVPITSDVTFEDPTVTSPEERERLFGQHDHVRRYGPDYRDRLVDVGFSVTVDGFVRELDERTISRYGLMRSEDVYFCRKEDHSAFQVRSSLQAQPRTSCESSASSCRTRALQLFAAATWRRAASRSGFATGECDFDCAFPLLQVPSDGHDVLRTVERLARPR